MIDPFFQNQFQDIRFLAHFIEGSSYIGVFLLSVTVSFIFPIPEAVMLVLFGYLAERMHMNIAGVILISAAGGIIGDNIVYRLSYFGNKYVERFNQKMRENKLIKYEYLVKDNIGKTIYFLRLVTGVRFFGPVISGTLGVRWRKFLLFDSGATFLHAAFFVGLGFFYHHRILRLIAEVEIMRTALFLSSVFIIGILVSVFSPKKKTQEKSQ